MTNEDVISKAFFKCYGITCNYLKKNGDAWEYREMTTISDVKYNNDSDGLVGGCMNKDGDYRHLCTTARTDITVYKYIDSAERSQ